VRLVLSLLFCRLSSFFFWGFSYGFDRTLLSQLAVAAVVGGRSSDQKIKALSFLELFGPADVHRKLCLDQGLCLVEIAVQDWKASRGTNRDSLYDFLHHRAGFETQLWDALVFGGQYTLDLAVDIANDRGVLAESLFRYLAQRPHLGVSALHNLQCHRFEDAALAFALMAEQEDVVLVRKKSLASLGFLAAKIRSSSDEAKAGLIAEMELKVCRAAAAVQARGVPLTRSAILQFCVTKLSSDAPSEIPAHVFAAAGLELCGDNDPEMLQIVRLVYRKDDWKEKLGYASTENVEEVAEWIRATVLGKLFSSAPPSATLLKAALSEESPELLSLVLSALGRKQ
jgi:hypothetical protein